MQRIVICVISDLENDQRVHRTALTLSEAGYDVLLIGRQPQKKTAIKRSYKTKRLTLLFTKTVMFFANYNINLFFYLLFRKLDIVIANDMDTLPACWLISRIRKKKLIFDSHEFYSESPYLNSKPTIKKIWQKLENLLIPQVDVGITVNRSIADIYKHKHNKYFHVIRNVPLVHKHTDNFKYTPNRIIYQGAVHVGRGVEMMLHAIALLPDMELYIAGKGDVWEKCIKLADTLNLKKRVFFLGHIDFEQLPNITKTAAVGLSLEEDIGLNYHYALPNKIFDYIQSNVPVIVSDLPEMRNIVETFDVGAVLTVRTSENLAKAIVNIIKKRESGKFEEKLKKAAEILNWENEKNKLLSIFAV